jgi:histidyl-tRNA synthetase
MIEEPTSAEAAAADLPGFPEWLPDDVLLEQRIAGAIRQSFEAFGYRPVDPAAIEPIDVLNAGGAQYSDGGIAKPVFGVTDPHGGRDAPPLGLRYDLTVPLARCIGRWASSIRFPLRCYQINKVWRAEEPTPSHWREFYQCDVDVIGDMTLDLVYDAEIAAVLVAAFDRIDLGRFTIHISNRRVLAELLHAVGVAQDRSSGVVAIIDDSRRRALAETQAALRELGLEADAVAAVSDLLRCESADDAERLLVRRGADTGGVDELRDVLGLIRDVGVGDDRIRVDFRITRGHDYYTGTVYETFVEGRDDWGAVGSGGRYEDLLRHFAGRQFPGVGVSIGLTRLFTLLRDREMRPGMRRPVDVVVDASREETRPAALAVARRLRADGVSTEVLFEQVDDPAEGRPATLVVAPVADGWSIAGDGAPSLTVATADDVGDEVPRVLAAQR